MFKLLIVSCATISLLTTSIRADDWPHWRGPTRNGHSAEMAWLDQWPTDGPRVAWKAKVGLGFSTFVVAKGRVLTTGHADDKDTVFCFDADSGKVLWKHPYPAELGNKYFEGGTTGTPTIDDERVYQLSRWGDVFCLDATTGRVIWSKNLQKEIGVRIPDWGFSGAPLVHGNLLILNVGDAGMALDKTSGKIVWQSQNKEAGYSTPLPMGHGNETLVLLGSRQSYVAVDVLTGKEAWRHRWLTQYGVNAADPVVQGALVFICTGYGKGGAMLKTSAGQPQELWKTKVFRTQLNPAVLVDGHLYGVDGDTTSPASLKCLEFATGAEKWEHPNVGSGALITAGGRLIVLSGTGELMVAPASPAGFKPTARAQVLKGKCWTSPVLANGRIYCRSVPGEVVCLDVRKP
ncbi:MAG: PQQ-binding-like beta-propeller repeat protein [Verrucomicrobia bacterium]|nr:PQQ-binding-like beta-propeller repeat protein [Verrucomicrobiota bacterium]